MEFMPIQFTVDSVLFTVTNNQLRVLLVKRAQSPYKGKWSLPGGFVDVNVDPSTKDTALRKLTLKAGIRPKYLEQLKVYDGLARDPRGFSVTLAYFALVAVADLASNIETVSEAKWFNVKSVEKLDLAFDHKQIVRDALARLKQKALYSMTPLYCCSQEFSMAQLQNVIETIIDRPIQRKTLMRRVEQSDMLIPLNKKEGGKGRKAQLFKVKENTDIFYFERNLES